jgi:hypothetical protein
VVGRPFSLPNLPRPGAVLSAAFLSPLAFADGTASLLPDFVEACIPTAAEAGIEFLTVGLPADSQGAAALRRRFHTRTWGSRFYQVQWPEKPALDLRGNGAGFFPDVALL